MKPVQFAPLASCEVSATALEYDDKVSGLGEKFITEVEAAPDAKKICTPEVITPKTGNTCHCSDLVKRQESESCLNP